MKNGERLCDLEEGEEMGVGGGNEVVGLGIGVGDTGGYWGTLGDTGV